MSSLTIVMYHYVRPLAGSLYPGIRGLELTDFIGQLDYLKNQGYSFVSMEEVAAAASHKHTLPDGAVLLTFDDGFLDHFLYVFPALRLRGISGAFFPPVNAIEERRVLDVHKIHFILASGASLDSMISFVEHRMDEARNEFSLRPTSEYRRELMESSTQG